MSRTETVPTEPVWLQKSISTRNCQPLKFLTVVQKMARWTNNTVSPGRLGGAIAGLHRQRLRFRLLWYRCDIPSVSWFCWQTVKNLNSAPRACPVPSWLRHLPTPSEYQNLNGSKKYSSRADPCNQLAKTGTILSRPCVSRGCVILIWIP